MTDMRDIRIEALPDDATPRIQAALDRGSAQGLAVRLEPGVHLSRGLRLGSGARLHLEAGAILSFLPSYDAYAQNETSVIAEGSSRAMILAEGAAGIAITGEGEIRCDGTRAFSTGKDEAMGTRIPLALRPRVLVFDGCRNSRIEGIRVTCSPMWTLHFVGCTGLRISSLCIDNDLDMPNTDGIVLDGCRDVRVSACSIRTADDGVVLKTSLRANGAPVGPCVDIEVARTRVESRSCALKLGTESHADFRDITFEDCEVLASNRGLGVLSRDGGTFERIVFRRIRLDCSETPDGYWGSGEALTINQRDRRPGSPAGRIRDVLVEDVTGAMEGAINLVAEHAGQIDGVTLRHVRLAQRAGLLGTGRCYDLRPGPVDMLPSADAGGRANAWHRDDLGRVIGLVPYPGGMPGLFARNVTRLHLDGVDMSRPSPLPEGWNPEVVVIA